MLRDVQVIKTGTNTIDVRMNACAKNDRNGSRGGYTLHLNLLDANEHLASMRYEGGDQNLFFNSPEAETRYHGSNR